MAFSISEHIENGFLVTYLIDESTDTRVGILPACGAILHEFSIPRDGGERLNVVDNYSSKEAYDVHKETLGFKSAKMNPYVCRVEKGAYNFEDAAYKLDKYYLGDHAMHGLLYDAAFSVIQKAKGDNVASLKMQYDYTAEYIGFPHHYSCIITYSLQANSELHISTRVINTGTTALPMTDGWHPYFTLGKKINDLNLEIQTNNVFHFTEAMIPDGTSKAYDTFSVLKPIGEVSFDDCFLLNRHVCQPKVVLKDLIGKVQIEIHPSDDYPYLQVYTPPSRDCIALENISALPDAFNNGQGLLILRPGQDAFFNTMFKIKEIP